MAEVKETSVFGSLFSNFRDAFFPEKLPPLVLESQPIAVVDRMKTQRSPTSTAVAVGLHVVAILLIALLIAKKVQVAATAQKNLAQLVAPPPPPPPIAPKKEAIGGGGGQHDVGPVTQGHLPKLSPAPQLVPVKAPPTVAPKLAVEPTLEVQKDLKMADNSMPNIGMPNSPLKGFSLGNGSGGGLGSGTGNGIGPGSGGNIGGGFKHIGGAVRPPVLTFQVEPEFSEEARKAKFSGNVEVYLIVDEKGNPTNIKVVRDVGMGLGAKAIEAVKQYKFKPAMENGKPVAVDMYIDVNFQIF